MAISKYTQDREKKKFVESTGTAGQPGVVVLNPDGSNISGGSGGGTSSNFGAANPTAGTAVGFSDGTNMQEARVYDTDSGAGSENTVGVILRKSASGGSVELGTSTNPIRTDPTATTTQPISGTVTSNVGTTNGLALDATLTGGTAQTKVTDGTNIANVLKSDGTATGQNSQMIGSAYQTQTFSVTSVTAGTSYDVGGYSWISIYITTQYTGSTPTITWQGSNDNTNWIGFSLLQPLSTISSGSLSTTASNVLYAGPLNFRYFRLNFTGTYTSGTAAGTILFSTTPRQTVNINGQIAINGTTGVNTTSATGSTVPANAFYMGILGSSGNLQGAAAVGSLNDGAASTNLLATGIEIYNGSTFDRLRSIVNATNSTGIGIAAAGLVAQLDDTSPTTITENQFGNLRIDTARQLRVNNQQSPDATVLNTYSVHLTTNTTTTPTSATAYISSIAISSEVAGTTSTVTIQDKQGTPLKLVNGFSTTTLTTTPTVVNFQTPAKMVSGIDIVTGGAAAATVDVWINYYQ